MKRIFIIFTIVIMSVLSAYSQTYSSQESKWIEKIFPADELKGNDEYTLYFYMNKKDKYSVTYRNNKKNIILIHSYEGIFDENYKVLVGLYKDGEMKLKISSTVDVSKDYETLFISGMDGLTIITWLEHGGEIGRAHV